jgi:hypothetical protein
MIIPDARVKQFAELAYERMRIHIKKELGFSKPWTDKPIFMDSFFCNVFIDQNIDDNYLWSSLVVSRFISRIDCLEQLRDAGAFDSSYNIADRLRKTREVMLMRRQIGLPLNTNAFITSPMIGKWGPTKAHYIVHLVEALMDEDLGARLEYIDTTMAEIHERLMEYQAVGSFMSYQYCVDFSYIPRYLGKAPDLNTWSAIGPGSIRGMNRMLFGTVNEKIPLSEWLENANNLHELWYLYVTGRGAGEGRDYLTVTRELIEELYDELDRQMEDGTRTMGERSSNKERVKTFATERMALFLRVRMPDVEHWLCEYDKYMRGGSSKRRYDGRST